jgi:hypothetical protein
MREKAVGCIAYTDLTAIVWFNLRLDDSGLKRCDERTEAKRRRCVGKQGKSTDDG